jgi:phage terminase large subunit
MKTESHELTPQQKAYVRKVISDPVLFASNVLGAKLWKRQIEILRSIQNRRRTAIKACHGVGKTYTLAVAALSWLARYHDGIVLTTSSTLRQVETQVWSEIRRVIAQAKIPYPQPTSTELKLRDDSNFALGFSTNRAENFQGYHGKHVLILADEAPGIEPEVWEAISGIMAGGKVHLVVAGNPTQPSGPFFDAFTRDRALWNCISIDAFDSPNFEGIGLDELLQMDPVENGPLDQNPVPYLVTRRWVYEQRAVWWRGDELSSPNWMSRVRGQFPDQAQNALVKLVWLERARARALQQQLVDTGERLVAGVDVGGGDAETVAYLCELGPHKHKIIRMGAWRGEDTRGEVVRFLAPYRERLSVVRVDSIGIGHNFWLHLRDQKFRVDPINVSLPCESRPGSNNPAERFANQKARFYQTLADAFEGDEIEGLTDEATIGQLAGLLYDIDSRGRIRIEPKERARQRGVPSPDRAEALMLALCKPPRRYESYSIRDPRRLRSRAAEDLSYADQPPHFGFTEVPDSDDDNKPVRPRRWRRGFELL